MKVISLWDFIRSEIHQEEKKQAEKQECPLACFLERNRIQDKEKIERNPWPKYPNFILEIFPWHKD